VFFKFQQNKKLFLLFCFVFEMRTIRDMFFLSFIFVFVFFFYEN
tara:strand:- start:136 stop:267 length:132 start_codon:yes stop_codon:yes gene_type:complete